MQAKEASRASKRLEALSSCIVLAWLARHLTGSNRFSCTNN